MRLILFVINKKIRKWNNHLEEVLGLKLEPHLLVACATAFIIVVQIFLSLLLCSSPIYCHLPNLRIFYQSRGLTEYEKLPTIYVITPTYERYVQKAELTRLSHTFMLVPNLHWILVEDSDRRTDMVSKFVRRLRSEYDFFRVTHLHEPTPERFKLKPGEPIWKHPKGVWQRNRALDWVRENLDDLDQDGVLYFADDDNSYDLELFNEMRYTRKVSVWPVGFVGGLLVERPMVDHSSGRVEKFNSMWEEKRPYPFDMAGFAVSVHLFLSHPNVSFSADQKIGYIESHFLSQLVDSWQDLEPKADKCTKILVWHTQTKKPTLHEERKLSIPSHAGLEL